MRAICCLSQDGASCLSQDDPSVPEISVGYAALTPVVPIGSTGNALAETLITTDAAANKKTPVATANTLISRDAFVNQTPPVATIHTVTVTHEGLPVTITKDRTSKEVFKLALGTRVNVVEFSEPDGNRIRGRIVDPAGWITLQSADTMVAFVERYQQKQRVPLPCPRCGALPTKSPKKYCADCSRAILENSSPPPPPLHTIPPPLKIPTQQVDGSSQKNHASSQRVGSSQKVDGSSQQVARAKSVAPTLEILFWHKGEETLVRFKTQPLGLQWRTKAPLAVDKVFPGSKAEEQGVQIGWQIRMIGVVDLTGQSFAVLSNTLKEALRTLPWEDGVRKSQTTDGFKKSMLSWILQ